MACTALQVIPGVSVRDRNPDRANSGKSTLLSLGDADLPTRMSEPGLMRTVASSGAGTILTELTTRHPTTNQPRLKR